MAPKLAPIEMRYLREALLTCDGYTWEACPDRGRLEAKYDAERAAAIESCK